MHKSPSTPSRRVSVNTSVEERKSYHAVPITDTSENDQTEASDAETSEDIPLTSYKVQLLSRADLAVFDAVQKGDLESVRNTLEKSREEGGNINRTDRCGFTALHYAVIYQFEEVVKLLLKEPSIKIFDTLHYAILEENVDIVQQLVAFNKRNPESSPEKDSDFPKTCTPLIMACKIGCLELIELFYDDGDRLSWCPEKKPTLYHEECDCNMCTTAQGLGDDYEKLSLWQAFANPVYITFIAGKNKQFDPVQEAFFLIKILQEKVIPKEEVFTAEYNVVLENLKQYTVDMLSMCRTTYESELMLTAQRDNKQSLEKYPRLRWALQLNHTDFVTHPHTQTIVYKWWAGEGWPAWSKFHPIVRIFHFITRFVLFIPVSILLLFDRESTLGKFFATPINIFLNSLASYLVFLLLLILQAELPYRRCNTEEGNLKDDIACTEKGPPRIGTEWPIILYVFGFMLASVKHFCPAKKGFFKYKWNVYNAIMQISFLITFICWLLAYINWEEQLSETGGVPPELPRSTWKSDDPILIAEAFFALSLMLSLGKVLQFVQVQSHFGPLQIGLGRILHKVFDTAIFFLFVMVSFAAGISGNYKAYYSLTDSKGEKVSNVPKDFADFWETTYNMFIGVYGLYSVDALGVEFEDITNENGTAIPRRHWANETTGKTMICLFHVFASLMLMNLIVAFFSKAFGDVQDDVLAAWKYVRAEVYLYYESEPVLPSPMNLLTFLNMYYYSKCVGKSQVQSSCNFLQCCYYQRRDSKQEAKKRSAQYFQMIDKLRKMYAALVVARKSSELANADDIKEVCEELDELKSIMIEKGLEPPPKEATSEEKDLTAQGSSRNSPPKSTTNSGKSIMANASKREPVVEVVLPPGSKGQVPTQSVTSAASTAAVKSGVTPLQGSQQLQGTQSTTSQKPQTLPPGGATASQSATQLGAPPRSGVSQQPAPSTTPSTSGAPPQTNAPQQQPTTAAPPKITKQPNP